MNNQVWVNDTFQRIIVSDMPIIPVGFDLLHSFDVWVLAVNFADLWNHTHGSDYEIVYDNEFTRTENLDDDDLDDDDLDDDDLDDDDFDDDTHKSMIFTSQNGNQATVLGSGNMSDETKMMLSKLIDVATNHIEKRIDCHACQGGGCPVCNGYGYYYAD